MDSYGITAHAQPELHDVAPILLSYIQFHKSIISGHARKLNKYIYGHVRISYTGERPGTLAIDPCFGCVISS